MSKRVIVFDGNVKTQSKLDTYNERYRIVVVLGPSDEIYPGGPAEEKVFVERAIKDAMGQESWIPADNRTREVFEAFIIKNTKQRSSPYR